MIFPAPYARETIASYGYRIARISGLASLPELTHLFDLDLAALLKGDDLSLARFAKYTGCDPSALANGALSTWSPQRLQMGANPENAAQCDTQRMRVCPACLEGLAEQDYANVCLGRTEWLVRSNHVCATHGLDHEVDPALIAELAPQLKDLLNVHDAARHLGISLDVFRVLLADGLIEPDYQFNRRMAGFRPETLDAFLVEWAGFGRPIPKRKRQRTLNLMIVARSHFTRTPLLLRAARTLRLELFHDRRKRGLAAVMIAERDVATLIEEARAERGRRELDRQRIVVQQ